MMFATRFVLGKTTISGINTRTNSSSSDNSPASETGNAVDSAVSILN